MKANPKREWSFGDTVSVEIVLHPKSATRDQLRRLLVASGFKRTKHLWDWPKGSLNYYWFDPNDYRSFEGVEATIYPPSDVKDLERLGHCAWALHTRTRGLTSPADQEQQNRIIRAARQQFGGHFYNDWAGKNRYSQVDPDQRDAAARGIYLTYEFVKYNLAALRLVLPEPSATMEKLIGTNLEVLSCHDPTRILYNALVPFAVAALEHFFSQCFKILLRYDPQARDRLRQQTRKIDLPDVLAIEARAKTIEDVVADWYSFQSIASIHTAFSEWFKIDFWKLLRRRRRIGTRLPMLEKHLDQLIEFRHGIVHQFSLDVGLRKHQIEEILDLALAVTEAFVEYLEKAREKPIRD